MERTWFSFGRYVFTGSILTVPMCYVAGAWSVPLVAIALRPTWLALRCASLTHFVLVGVLVSEETSSPFMMVLLTLYLSWLGQLVPLLLGILYLLLRPRQA